MGQYHLIANLDKREYIHPHLFGDGLKLLEFGSSAGGTLQGLALLLAVSNKDDSTEGPFSGHRGGGDFHVWADPYGDGRDVGDVTKQDHQLAKAIIGRWGGDRIAIIGDYAEDGDVPSRPGEAHVRLTWAASNPQDNPWADERATDDQEGRTPIWLDLSAAVRRVMGLDYYTRQQMDKSAAESSWIAERFAEGGDPYAVLGVEAVS